MTTELTIVRHGETAWNAAGRIQGHLGEGLNARGRAQAQAAARRLAGERFVALISSDLERALETATAISTATGLPVRPDPRLREWDLGILSGRLRSDAERDHPHAFRIYSEHRVEPEVPGGESIRARYRRTTGCLEAIAAEFPGGRVVVVSHGGVLDDFYRRATGKPLDAPRDFQLYNAGLHRFRIDAKRWELIVWGDIEHLEGIGSMGHWHGVEAPDPDAQGDGESDHA